MTETNQVSTRDPKEILFAYGDENDASAHPWWGIVEKVTFGPLRGQYVLLAGPFFSRKSATGKLEGRRYHYGKRAIVYCFSGHDSPDYVELRRAVSGERWPR